MVAKVNVLEKLALFQSLWTPHVVCAVGGCLVKLVKFQGEFIWHRHADEDEMFLCVEGRFSIQFRDSTIELEPWELAVVPRGEEHRTIAPSLACALVVEPASTVNTGDKTNQLTHETLRWI